MRDMTPVGIQSSKRPFESRFFVINLGETVGDAMARHYRTHGVGRLILMRDFNVARVAGRHAQHSMAA